MGISNNVQAALVSVSAALIVVGTAVATIPAGIPDPIKATITVVCWTAGVAGLAIKEAAGTLDGTPTAPAK